MQGDLINTHAARVSIDGQAVQASTQMTVAAALFAAGQLHTRRSVRGEARFALCGMGVCQECRVCIDGQAHRLACQVFCQPGMVITTDGAAAR